ncbi:MAG: ABC transporter substrate-binding protein [Dehalococcoidia bacterium]|nr:ABC transporter substrate-binding protein [Dehalococcoidia bacterium]
MRLVIRALLCLALGLLVGPSLVACGMIGGGAGDDPTPAPTAPPQTPTPPPPPPEYPRTVTDLLGRDVEFRRRPVTVVALSQSAVEFVYAAGGEVAGRPTGATYPPEAATAVEVGDAYAPDIAAIHRLDPDLVVADSVIHSLPAIRGELEALGVPVIFAGASNYPQVLEAISVVGAALGTSLPAQIAVDEIISTMLAAQAALGQHGTTATILLADRSGTLYSALDSGFAGDLLLRLGFINPTGSGEPSGPFPGYTILSTATLIDLDPDLIFTISTSSVPLSQALAQDPALSGLRAIAGGRLIELDASLALRAPGPRVVELISTMGAAVTP